ncbi:hypothetical protein GWI33_019930 [Rhynchophorus ferrugineus]|uniref:MYND-type domain-containing protein n=1 Tax=Rhynchophorus ferrugineus TaxID=354439 RepID=A0A834HSC0_RHYFE|nr:hypothetical protein GWI33_019930 [Rhynchophorus ferrugineus]
MSSQSDARLVGCNVCGFGENLLRCARCKVTLYCSKEHQKKDWKKHKVNCNTHISSSSNLPSEPGGSSSVEQRYGHTYHSNNSTSIPIEGSSESEILSAAGETLTLALNNNFDEKSSTERAIKNANSAMPIAGENIVQPKPKGLKYFPEVSLNNSSAPFQHNIEDDVVMCTNIIQDLSDYGLCVLDNFLGYEEGKKVLAEVLHIKNKGALRDGQLVSTKGKAKEDLKTIRSDKICWVDGKEKDCQNIGFLIGRVDTLITRANRMVNNGKLRQYNINGRTKNLNVVFTVVVDIKENKFLRRKIHCKNGGRDRIGDGIRLRSPNPAKSSASNGPVISKTCQSVTLLFIYIPRQSDPPEHPFTETILRFFFWARSMGKK